MPCLLVIFALGFPRLALFLIWLLSDWIGSAFETKIWPLLGFFFFPYTTLCYLWASLATHHRINGGWVFLIVFGVLLDLASSGSARRRKRRARR
ncbi:MAG TPA: hypothetical protein VN541_06370 [Tepidisphaeraceae bacterium]|nr:hypothetical protein [Tepidisphaeraceae bacterium]